MELTIFSCVRLSGGKSAIMTALVVGLGGKAATTNRGNSLKGFIKDKCRLGIVLTVPCW